MVFVCVHFCCCTVCYSLCALRPTKDQNDINRYKKQSNHNLLYSVVLMLKKAPYVRAPYASCSNEKKCLLNFIGSQMDDHLFQNYKPHFNCNLQLQIIIEQSGESKKGGMGITWKCFLVLHRKLQYCI